jgi:ABC-type glycerol-3-phosphate transport system substrate-binding protein
MHSKRFISTALALLFALSLVLAACGDNTATTAPATPAAATTAASAATTAASAATTAASAATTAASAATTAAATSGKKVSGEISVYLNSYYDPTADKETADVTAGIAKEYEAAHPGTKINLVAAVPAGTDLEAWLAARMAANQSPDIMWQQFSTRNQRASSWWVPLNQYFNAPNPYIAAGTAGHDKWLDSVPSYVSDQTKAPDGNWYQVSLDWVETGLYYNKDLFAKAGVDPTTWKSWGNFVTDMKSVKTKTGVNALGMFVAQQGWSNWWWVDDMLLTANWADKANDFYMDKYKTASKFRQLNAEEVAKAIIDGKLNATDPRMDNFLKMSKDYVGLLPSDYASIPNLDELDPLFFGGKVASVWTGTWKNKLYAKSIPFNYGIAYLPPFTKDDAPGGTGTAYRVGGPSSAGQYGIAQSAAKAGKLDLALDFLQFISAPQNFGRMSKAFGGYIPMVAGAQSGDVMAGFTKIAELPERLFNDPGNRLTVESGNQWSQAMQGFFLGQTDVAATKTKLQEIWMSAAKQLCTDQKYDWCK